MAGAVFAFLAWVLPFEPRAQAPFQNPPIPADALRSRLSGETMVCWVAVEAD